MTISDVTKKYRPSLDFLDLELLCAHTLGKSREFVLAHSDFQLSATQQRSLARYVTQRLAGKPLAQIVGHKEFHGLDFVVNKHTLIPRPETEQLVELALAESRSAEHKSPVTIIDVGTGSGCIIVTFAHELEGTSNRKPRKVKYYAVDISKEALKVAKTNARSHGVSKNIQFLHGSLLDPVIEKYKPSALLQTYPRDMSNQSWIITANLPYLSKEIYQSAPRDVKDFEPKSALYSPKAGLAHYAKLLRQISVSCKLQTVSCFMEISPEQKKLLAEMVKKILPQAKTKFHQDLAGKWRICEVRIA